MSEQNSDTSAHTSSGQERIVAALIFTTLYALYLLTFSGAFRTVDELAMYAMTESMAQQGELATTQVLFTPFHNPVGTVEPAQPLLAAPLYWLAQRFAAVNNIHAVMLLPPLVTALTATLLYLIGRKLAYKQSASIAIAFTFGLATLAWPYSRTFLREPLLALCFTLAFYAHVAWRRAGHIAWLGIMTVLLMLATTIKSIGIVVAPFFLIATAIEWIRLHPHNRKRLIVLGVGGTLLVGAAGLLAIYGRYGSFDFFVVYISQFATGDPLGVIYGLLFSPGKGIVFYMPIVIVAWIAIARARQQRMMYVWLSGLALLGMAFVYGNNSAWYGGQAWGPRFLVPLLPLLVFPVIERIERRSTWVLIALSFILQIGVVSANWALAHKVINRINQPFETTIGLDPTYWHVSPPFNQLRFWTLDRADLLWAHPDPNGGFTFDPILALGLIGIIAISIVLLRQTLRTQHLRVAKWSWPMLIIAATALLLGRGWIDTPSFPGLTYDEAQTIARPAFEVDAQGYTAVTVSNEFHIYYMLGFMKGSFQHLWYSPLQADGFDDLANVDPTRDLTLTIDRGHLTPDLSGDLLRNWLNLNAYQFGGGFVGGYERINYTWGPAPADLSPFGTLHGNLLALDEAALGAESFVRGEAIPLELKLRKLAALPHILIVKTRLAADNGLVIGGHDGPIQFGTLNLEGWSIDSSIIDRRAFPIPADVPPGTYTLQVGFETLDGFLETEEGQAFVNIGQVNIGSQN